MSTETIPSPPPTATERLPGRRLDDIPTPPEVRKLLDAVTPVSDPSRAALERDYKLSFLYGGQEVAVRGDGAETEILKAGTIEVVAQWMRTLTDGRWEQVTVLMHPDPWELVRWQMRHALK